MTGKTRQYPGRQILSVRRSRIANPPFEHHNSWCSRTVPRRTPGIPTSSPLGSALPGTGNSSCLPDSCGFLLAYQKYRSKS